MPSLLKLLGIPFAMATQHPDSASRAIKAAEEVEEAVNDLMPLEEGGFGCDEKMIDYEGKMTPYHQPQWILEELVKLGLIPGEDFILTPRIPAERLESADRQVMVIWASLAANKYAIDHGGQAIKYMIHPMSESSRDLVVAQRRILKLQKFAEEEIGLHLEEPIRLIPLIEDAVRQIHSDKLMASFYQYLAREEGIIYEGYRVFLGKSDASLAYGHLTASISLKIALSRLAKWAYEEKVKVYPMIGVGKPPFRGHLAPDAVDVFVKQYSGYFTVTIQSALRFDTPRDQYIRTYNVLRDNVGREVQVLEDEEERILVEAARKATSEYLKFLLQVADRVVEVAKRVPSKRDRLPVEKYGRDISPSIAFTADPQLISVARRSIPLPRAIKFTCSLYTMGMPPALIGLGRGLERIAREMGDRALDLVLRILPLLKLDAEFETAWIDLDLARSYVGEKPVELYRRDLMLAKEYLDIEERPVDEEYRQILWTIRKAILANDAEASRLIDEAGKRRGFLG